MKNFFRGVRKHIGKLDAEHLREQYEILSQEFAFSERLLDTIDRGVIALDERGRIVYANPAARTLLGEDLENALAALALEVDRACKLETVLSYPEVRTLEVQTFPMERGALVYLRDTSLEKARTEAELRQGATRAVCDLAAGVAHEIGNPLNAISMALQLIERDPTDRDSIALCRAQVARLDGIIREFLTALRPTRLNLAPGSPADPLKNCLAALRGQFTERRIQVTLDIPAALPPVALDKEKLEQVFFNLIKNALEAMKDGGKIDIEIAADDREVAVVFRDSGAGMTAEQLSHLFEPYHTSKSRGTGLGLMISKRIVEEHGGTIAVTSEPRLGSVFSVRLPRLEKRIRVLKG